MESERLVKVGDVDVTPDGTKVLVKEEGVAYAIIDQALFVWGAFEGNTVGEVATKLAGTSGRT